MKGKINKKIFIFYLLSCVQNVTMKMRCFLPMAPKENLDLKGKRKLFARIQSLLNRYSIPIYQISEIENGWNIDIPKLSHTFHIQCFPPIGWNVFLVPKTPSFFEDVYTMKVYDQLEKIIDVINFEYFDFTLEEKEKLDSKWNWLKNEIQRIQKQCSIIIKKVVYKEPGIIRIYLRSFPNSYIDLGYSRIFQRWFIETIGEEERKNLFISTQIQHHLDRIYQQMEQWNREQHYLHNQTY